MGSGIIKIDENRCKGCLLCIEECKRNEIREGIKINRSGYLVVEFVNSGKCNACTRCSIICPEAAIEIFVLEEAQL